MALIIFIFIFIFSFDFHLFIAVEVHIIIYWFSHCKLLLSAASPECTQASTSAILNFQNLPIRCPGRFFFSRYTYMVSRRTPRYSAISLMESHLSSIKSSFFIAIFLKVSLSSIAFSDGGCHHIPFGIIYQYYRENSNKNARKSVSFMQFYLFTAIFYDVS